MTNHKLIILLLISVCFIFTATAQEADSTIYVKAANSELFSTGTLVDECLSLSATQTYDNLTDTEKIDAVKAMLTGVGARRAVVNSKSGNVLWYNNGKTLVATKLGSNKYNPKDYKYLELDRLGAKKWYLTFGGQMAFDSDSYSLGLNARAGSFLFKNIIDWGLGVNFNGLFLSDSDDDDGTCGILSLDLSTRLYLSKWLPKSRLVPYAGFGLGYTVDVTGDDSGSFEPVFSVGANWYISKGSFDLSLQYGTERDFSLNIGYTISF